MACKNWECERSCLEGVDWCCAPCARDAGGGRKSGVPRRMRGVFHTHACEERESARQAKLAPPAPEPATA